MRPNDKLEHRRGRPTTLPPQWRGRPMHMLRVVTILLNLRWTQ